MNHIGTPSPTLERTHKSGTRCCDKDVRKNPERIHKSGNRFCDKDARKNPERIHKSGNRFCDKDARKNPERNKSVILSYKAKASAKQQASSKKTGYDLSTGALIWQRAQTYAMVFLCTVIGFTLFYLLYFALPRIVDRPVGSPVFPSNPTLNWTILIAHALTAIPPLFIGMFAFSKRLRNASLKWHRWIGTTYCVCIWISAVLGVLLALANTHGLIAQAGFGFLGIGWFTTTWFAYKTARRKDIVSHRRWMIRSFALTLAVVTIRPMFLIDPLYGFSKDDWYLLATWICWVPNLFIGEIYLRVTKPNGKFKAAPK